MHQTAETHQWTTDILQHAEWLLDTSLSKEQRERLQYIRHAAQSLMATLNTPSATPHPATEPSDTSPMTSTTTEKKPNRILLVEDNPFTQKLITRLLSLQGYQVTLAQNGQEALHHLRKNSFDLTLMDLRMPVMDGFETTATIRRQEAAHHQPHMPIIAVTAMIEEKDKKRAMETGMDGFHAKPVRATILFGEMERLLNKTPSDPPPSQPDPAPADTPPIIDMSRILHTVDGDRVLLQEIIDLYFNDAPRQLARIQQAIEQGQASEIREAAHSFKGATGAFGRIEVYHLALAMEQAGRDGDLPTATTLWHQINDALKIMEQAVRTYMNDHYGESS